jgi:cytochrome c-type biogenesis protein CcmH
VSRLLLIVLCLFVPPAFGIENVAPFDDPAMQDRYEHIVKELRCLVCQNESIADSDAPLAADLRREVREMMLAGKSDADIQKFMVDRYGEWILFRPRLLPQTWLLWFAPAILLVLGLAVAARVVSKRSHMSLDDLDDHTEEQNA